MEKRTTLKVALDILIQTKEPIGKTKIVYQCNLNFNIIKRWIPLLISKGLLEECDNPPRTWRTTEKGSRFIEAMERVLWIWKTEALDNGTVEAIEPGIFKQQMQI